MNRILYPTIFAVGLLAIAWVGAGYIPGNPLALSLVLLKMCIRDSICATR